ncbi:MAG: hypothetical protein IT363_11775 [Methanoregulaceae archaeon]|nr:hypothetical protein [Methanoregulaceae archaeon]
MRLRILLAGLSIVAMLGCFGGANAPYVPNGGGGVSSFGLGGGGTSTISPGGTATFDIFVDEPGGDERPLTPRAVTLTAVGLPANATPSFSVNPVTPTRPASRSILSVSTPLAIAPGTYPFTVQGSDGVNTRTVSCSMVVNETAVRFLVTVEALDDQISNQPGYPTDDPTANYRVSVTAPQGYQGQARLEWRFTEQGSPTADDIIGVWHYGTEQSGGTLEFTIGPNNLTDSAECTLQRQRNMTLTGTFPMEFRVVPLVGGNAPEVATSTLTVFFSGIGTRIPKR